jgi:hypothetical protein
MGDIRWNMTNHPPTPGAILVIEALREGFINLAENVEMVCPPGRERSLAITNMEQALMWAVAAIAREVPVVASTQEMEGQLSITGELAKERVALVAG